MCDSSGKKTLHIVMKQNRFVCRIGKGISNSESSLIMRTLSNFIIFIHHWNLVCVISYIIKCECFMSEPKNSITNSTRSLRKINCCHHTLTSSITKSITYFKRIIVPILRSDNTYSLRVPEKCILFLSYLIVLTIKFIYNLLEY